MRTHRGGIMLPEFYNQLGAMHGTIMVFLGVVPLAVGGFGNFVVPLQIGAPDMAFPKLNMTSYWVYFARRRRHARQLLRSGRRGAVRLDLLSAALATSHPRPDVLADRDAVPDHLVAAGRVNFIATIVQLRAPGMTLDAPAVFRLGAVRHRVPAAARLPGAEAAAVLQLMDRSRARVFSCRAGWSSAARSLQCGGGNALIWQHLFWFLGHPEVYVLILPAMGIVAEIIANNTASRSGATG